MTDKSLVPIRDALRLKQGYRLPPESPLIMEVQDEVILSGPGFPEIYEYELIAHLGVRFKTEKRHQALVERQARQEVIRMLYGPIEDELYEIRRDLLLSGVHPDHPAVARIEKMLEEINNR